MAFDRASDHRTCRKISCNICTVLTPDEEQEPFTPDLVEKYKNQYGLAPTINVPWAPNFMCKFCRRDLVEGSRFHLPRKPMLWTEPVPGNTDCIVCSRTCEDARANGAPGLMEREYFDAIVEDLELTPDQAKLLASRLRENNLLEPGTTFKK